MIKIKNLNRILDLPIDAFFQYGKPTQTPEGIYFFKDQGAKILAVAHLDTVQKPSKLKQKHEIIRHNCLDDRLGAYLLIETLPLWGVKFDLLLTEGEEHCASTAAYFEPPRQYNWIFSFDRAGTDVVTYQYDSQKIKKLLIENNFTPSFGSYSDICVLDHLGCKGFNFGTGLFSTEFQDTSSTTHQKQRLGLFQLQELYRWYLFLPQVNSL
jgi:hypothetical protein